MVINQKQWKTFSAGWFLIFNDFNTVHWFTVLLTEFVKEGAVSSTMIQTSIWFLSECTRHSRV